MNAQYTRRYRDGATMRVRSVWLNGKRWQVSDPHNGMPVVVAVFRDASDAFPRTFGPRLARTLALASAHLIR